MSDFIKLSSPATHEFWEIPVLFEDDHLFALNKPPCLLTSPDRYDANRPNLMKLLHAAIADRKPWASQRNLTYLANAHRLDFETSGVILLAKSKPTLVGLADLFGSENIKKVYAAITAGNPPQNKWETDAALSPHPARVGQMRVDAKGGKKSRTQFSVRETFRGYTLLEARPLTGRTHQIRVHLKHSGFPICGDRVYGGQPLLLSTLKKIYRLKPGKSEHPLIETLALHAEQLEFVHPITGHEIRITAEAPKSFSVALKQLRRHVPA